jgi:hypothetical protein
MWFDVGLSTMARLACGTAAIVWLLASAGIVQAADAMLPEIRTTGANTVPACITPQRLTAFLKTRNGRLDPRYKDIASHYKAFGEAWHVRWDYAFFQMVIETNFLTYRKPDGSWGDVDPKQNNFAGIGTTGGGVPGDSFPDVKTGVLAQIQHLVVYSGERVADPVASRTQLKQDDILEVSLKLRRPVRFSDLARRWAIDRNYAKSIEWAAESYRSSYCRGQNEVLATAAPDKETLPWQAAHLAAAKQSSAKSRPPKPVAAVKPAPKPTAVVRTVWSSSERHAPKTADTTPVAEVAGTGSKNEDNSTPVKPREVAAAVAPAGLGVPPPACSVHSASYGGQKTLLVRTTEDSALRYTALTVLDGFEKSMLETFLKASASGGESLGEFPNKAGAIAKARELCPGQG